MKCWWSHVRRDPRTACRGVKHSWLISDCRWVNHVVISEVRVLNRGVRVLFGLYCDCCCDRCASTDCSAKLQRLRGWRGMFSKPHWFPCSCFCPIFNLFTHVRAHPRPPLSFSIWIHMLDEVHCSLSCFLVCHEVLVVTRETWPANRMSAYTCWMKHTDHSPVS